MGSLDKLILIVFCTSPKYNCTVAYLEHHSLFYYWVYSFQKKSFCLQIRFYNRYCCPTDPSLLSQLCSLALDVRRVLHLSFCLVAFYSRFLPHPFYFPGPERCQVRIPIISKELCSEPCIARGWVATFGSKWAASAFKGSNTQTMSSILWVKTHLHLLRWYFLLGFAFCPLDILLLECSPSWREMNGGVRPSFA